MNTIVHIPPAELVRNDAIVARAGKPDTEKIASLVSSFLSRRKEGLPHQLMPGLVRNIGKNGKDKFELIDGDHRAMAEAELNELLEKGDEPFLFEAKVVKSGADVEALVEAITANEYRVASTVFDRGAAMLKLLALGKSQVEIAKLYGLRESTVSNTIKLMKAPKKVQKLVESGDLEQDAAIFIGGLSEDDGVSIDAVLEECLRHRTRYEEFEAKVNKRAAERLQREKIEALGLDKATADAAAKEAEKKIKAHITAAKEAKEKEAKAKDAKALEAARAETAKLSKESKAAIKEAEKRSKEAEALAAKIEEEKERLKAIKTQPVTTKKVTVEDAKKAAKESGKTGISGGTALARKEFLVELEALGEEIMRDNKLTKGNAVNLSPACAMLVAIDDRLGGEITFKQFKNQLLRNCREAFGKG